MLHFIPLAFDAVGSTYSIAKLVISGEGHYWQQDVDPYVAKEDGNP